ncbi:MAG: hypothetical protein AAGD14_00215 [Planctomycetota bacterium]
MRWAALAILAVAALLVWIGRDFGDRAGRRDEVAERETPQRAEATEANKPEPPPPPVAPDAPNEQEATRPAVEGLLRGLDVGSVAAVPWEKWIEASQGGRVPSHEELKRWAVDVVTASPAFRIELEQGRAFALFYAGPTPWETRDPPRVRAGDRGVVVPVAPPRGKWWEVLDIESGKPIPTVTARLVGRAGVPTQSGPGAGLRIEFDWPGKAEGKKAALQLSAPGYLSLQTTIDKRPGKARVHLLRSDALQLAIVVRSASAATFGVHAQLFLSRVSPEPSPNFRAPILERADGRVVVAVPEGRWSLEPFGYVDYSVSQQVLTFSFARAGTRTLTLDLPALATIQWRADDVRYPYLGLRHAPLIWSRLGADHFALRPAKDQEPRGNMLPLTPQRRTRIFALPGQVEWQRMDDAEKRIRKIEPKPGDTIEIDLK